MTTSGVRSPAFASWSLVSWPMMVWWSMTWLSTEPRRTWWSRSCRKPLPPQLR
jgi:hypothetical protein